MKYLLLISLFTTSLMAQLPKVSVFPKEMLTANCIPASVELESKEKYVQDLFDKGLNLRSLLKYPAFTKEHYNDIYMATKYFEAWMNLLKNSDWKFIRVIYKADLDSVANAFIALGPKWLEFESLHRQAIIIHELAHRLSTRLNDVAYKPRWANSSEAWDKAVLTASRRWRLTLGDESQFVSKYSKVNPSEDWAESVISYRIDPYALKAISPKKYDFIKERAFFGVEYLDDSTCSQTPTAITSDKAKSLARKYLNDKYREIKKRMSKSKTLKRSVIETLKGHPNYLVKLFFENLKSYEGLKDTKAYRKSLKLSKGL